MICGSGPNGAIIHYRAEHRSAAKIDPRQPLLIDTGAHYKCGTTDTTRTLLFDEHKEGHHFYYYDLKEYYTRVLMANLDLQETKFYGGAGKGTYANNLEPIGRKNLWAIG
jgi:Xaa-Pro aminopeptidase